MKTVAPSTKHTPKVRVEVPFVVRRFSMKGPPTAVIDAYIRDGCYRPGILFRSLAGDRRANDVFATMEATGAPMWSIVEPSITPKKIAKRIFLHNHPLYGGLIEDVLVELALALWLGLFSAQEISDSNLVAAIVFALKSNVDWTLRAHFFRSVMESHHYFGLFGREGLKLITDARPR